MRTDVQVTAKEFWSRLKADPRDIMPSNNNRNHTEWKDRCGVLFAVTFPGWANPGGEEKYFICKYSETIPAVQAQ